MRAGRVRAVSTPERFTCLKMRRKLRRSTMIFSQLPHMRTSISPDPRLVYIPLNISICITTFQDACRSCERSVSTPERLTCLKMRRKLRRSTMIFSQLPHMRTSISPDPRLVYIPLNISICIRTFQDACRSCERSVSSPERFTCLKMRPELRRSTMIFSQLPHMRTSITPDPRLIYIPLNISICMRTFQDACRSCERSVGTPERFSCFKMRPELRRSTMIFSQLPHMRTSISPVSSLVFIPLNMSICMRSFTDACRSCESSRDKKEYFTCSKKGLDLHRTTLIFSKLPACALVYHLFIDLHNEPEVLSNQNKTSASRGDSRQFAWYLCCSSNFSPASNFFTPVQNSLNQFIFN